MEVMYSKEKNMEGKGEDRINRRGVSIVLLGASREKPGFTKGRGGGSQLTFY